MSEKLKPCEWTPVCGYDGLYEISKDGHVCSLRSGNGIKPGRGAIVMEQKPKKGGYVAVGLRRPGERQRFFMIHRLMLEAFRGPCPAGMEARHLDGNPSNNRIENLEWATSKTNNADKKAHGTWQGGERNGNSKLTADSVREARSLYAEGWSFDRIADEFLVSRETIRMAVRGKTWNHI